MVNIRVRNIKGRKYAYARRVNSKGKTIEKYLGPVEIEFGSKGVRCPRCGKKISDQSIKKEIIRTLEESREKMLKEKRHLSEYARYELLNVLIDAFSDWKRTN